MKWKLIHFMLWVNFLPQILSNSDITSKRWLISTDIQELGVSKKNKNNQKRDIAITWNVFIAANIIPLIHKISSSYVLGSNLRNN